MGHAWWGDAGWQRGPFWVLSKLCSILRAACPKAHGSRFPCIQSSSHEDFGAARGVGKPNALPDWCQVPPGGSSAALARPMGSSIIYNRKEILQHSQATGASPLLSSRPWR